MAKKLLSLSFLAQKCIKSSTSWKARTEDGIEASVKMPGTIGAKRGAAALAEQLNDNNPVCSVSLKIEDEDGETRSRAYTMNGRDLAPSVHCEAAVPASIANRANGQPASK